MFLEQQISKLISDFWRCHVTLKTGVMML